MLNTIIPTPNQICNRGCTGCPNVGFHISYLDQADSNTSRLLFLFMLEFGLFGRLFSYLGQDI